MKKTIFTLAALAAVTAAAPALADSYHYGYRDNGGYAYGDYGRGDYDYRGRHRDSGWMRSVESRAAQLMSQVEQARRSGRISSYLANSIRGKVGANVATAYRYQRDGLSRSEVEATERRFQQEYARMAWASREGRAYGYGW